MEDRFGCDTVIAVATVEDGRPYVRNVNSYYENGSFYIITYALSNKMRQIAGNPEVAVCGEWFTGHGIAENMGHILKEENVKATFFIIGKNAERRKNLLKREFDEGHTIGVHSYSHKYKEIYSSTESLLKDIEDCNSVIKEVTGRKSTLYRFPGGSFGLSSKLVNAVTAHFMRYIDWNASFCDSEIASPSPEQLVRAAKTTVANPQSVIMLAHDATDKTATAEALRDVIRHFKDNGYTFKAF